MAKLMFSSASFVTSAVKKSQYPVMKGPKGNLLPEIAFAGRSNVGKSTLINHVLGAKGLAKTSSTPGKTQLLNFFLVDERLLFADLPGYGYARVPLKTRLEWGPMVQGYLEAREALQVIIFLFDIRRKPNEEDIQFVEWVQAANKQLVLVLTKMDKVSKNEGASNARQIVQAFPPHSMHSVIKYSAPKNIGRRELIAAIQTALDAAE